jgi:membrane protein insertase Oxa1/YidC/SpoIIIJ
MIDIDKILVRSIAIPQLLFCLYMLVMTPFFFNLWRRRSSS